MLGVFWVLGVQGSGWGSGPFRAWFRVYECFCVTIEKLEKYQGLFADAATWTRGRSAVGLWQDMLRVCFDMHVACDHVSRKSTDIRHVHALGMLAAVRTWAACTLRMQLHRYEVSVLFGLVFCRC